MAKLKIHEKCPSDGPGDVKAIQHRVGSHPKAVRIGYMCLDCFSIWPTTSKLDKPWDEQKPLIGPRPHPQQYRTEAALRRGVAEAQSYFSLLNNERKRRFPTPEERAAEQAKVNNRRNRNLQQLKQKRVEQTQAQLDNIRRAVKKH